MTYVWWGLQDMFWAGLAALGFAILFNVPVRTLAACALGGAVGHAVRTGLMRYGGVSIEAATLMGAMAVGLLATGFARIWKAPVVVFAVPGVIPMVPGSFAFRTMMGLLELSQSGSEGAGPIVAEMVINGAKTMLILGGIALGIATPTLLFRRQRPLL